MSDPLKQPHWIGDLDGDDKLAALTLSLRINRILGGSNLLVCANAVMLTCVAMIGSSKNVLTPDEFMEGLTHSAIASYANMHASIEALKKQETP